MVMGGLGPTHLVTYVVVGAHVQLVHCASMLFHLWVLPATVYKVTVSQDSLSFETLRRGLEMLLTASLANLPKNKCLQKVGIGFFI